MWLDAMVPLPRGRWGGGGGSKSAFVREFSLIILLQYRCLFSSGKVCGATTAKNIVLGHQGKRNFSGEGVQSVFARGGSVGKERSVQALIGMRTITTVLLPNFHYG